KRLKTSADFRRTDDCNSWILRNDFRLPTEDEIHDLIKPEFCCAYASMTAAEQRLKGISSRCSIGFEDETRLIIVSIDAGFRDKYNLGFDDDDDDEQSNHLSELDDEILQAPWNTTRAYLSALKGKCSIHAFGIGGK
ncbi:unnamed protein product, partial [Adineta steineri]